MKLNSFFLLAFGVLLCACEDTLTNIGSTIRPDGDNLTVKSAIFNIKSSTFLADSIYIRTSSPLLGEINDNLYGTIRSDYAAEFYGKGFTLNAYDNDTLAFQLGRKGDSLLYNRLDSAVLNIIYSAFIGDSTAPMAVTAYELSQPLPSSTDAFYSNVDFTPYISPLKELGSTGYTARDPLAPTTSKLDTVQVVLDQELSDRFLEALRNKPSSFSSQENFEKLFPGLYLKNTFGNGTILKIAATEIFFHYRTYHPTTTTQGKDSAFIRNRSTFIQVTPDVIQLNSLENPIQPGGNPELMNNDSATFITSPGGYFTQIKLPVGAIIDTLNADKNSSNQYLNGVNLNMLAYSPTKIFSQNPPKYMLLIEKSKMNEFFEQNKTPDNKTSFIGVLPDDTTKVNFGYDFGNINKMVLALAEELKSSKGVTDLTEQDSVTLAIVPISVGLDSYNNIIRVSNYFLPGGISLKGGKNTQQATMVYTLKVNE
ncbi:MAG: DUF4270 domain-containing protein [Bacteroidales bacterium]